MTRRTTRGGHPNPCTCGHCRAANAAYERNRYRKIGYGQWDPWMTAAPVREHVTGLMAAGVGLYRIAGLAGVSPGALRRLLYGAPCEGKAPSARIRREIAQAVLAVTAAEPNLSANTLVDATGTRRRLRALIALGWPATALAPHAGLHLEHVRRIVRGYPQVTAGTARSVRDAYGRLQGQPPPGRTRWERSAAGRCRARAQEAGWAVPARWDDAALDDPAASPDAGYVPSPWRWTRPDDGDVDEIAVELAATGERGVPLNRAELEAAAAMILAHGGNTQRIVERLHVNGTLAKELMAEARAAITAGAAGAGCAA